MTGALAILELGAFFVIERRLRRGDEAVSLERGIHDRGSTTAIGVAFGLAMTSAPAASVLRRTRLPGAFGWAGVAVMAVGIGLRAWAAKTLGANYTRTLRVAHGQLLVDSGPYSVVRHPGYAADILMWIGYGLAWTNFVSVALATVPTLAAYLYRIRVEEAMLSDLLGESYEHYRLRTSRLVPGIW